jgi:hypothetical protein
VRRRCHLFVSLLAIALQALDAVVGGLGHSHAHTAVAAAACSDHGTACSHHHEEAPQPASSDDEDHDDCSLCRHFSQAVAPVALTIELIGSQRVEPFVSARLPAAIAAPPSTHLARGPPASCA